MTDCGQDSAAGKAAAYHGGGQADWFLPSKNGLTVPYKHKLLVGGLAGGSFWSSSQSGGHADGAWYQNFDYGHQNDHYKDDVRVVRVRPVRAF